MPNHTTNVLELTGYADEVTAFVNKVSGGNNTVFDFNTIVPIPQELVGTKSPTDILTQEEIDKAKAEYEAKDDKYKANYIKMCGELTKYSFGMTKEQSAELIAKYGYDGWYNWQCNNWGTKWGAYDVVGWDNNERGYAIVTFFTAWTPPTPFLVSASKVYPNIKFKNAYSDEGGGFVGQVEIEDGVITEFEPEWYSKDGIALRVELGAYSEGSDYEIEGRLEFIDNNPDDAGEGEVDALKKELVEVRKME